MKFCRNRLKEWNISLKMGISGLNEPHGEAVHLQYLWRKSWRRDRGCSKKGSPIGITWHHV